jgi:pimeloyl-ACP methyl ester carboxylesterase
MVDIGGRSMYASCLGESAPGEPTVVFEHGLGGGAGAWVSTQLAVAETVRACVYARAGAGPSDPAGTAPRTTQDLADDLTVLLARAEIQPPYVFVSHSMGPWVTTLYTVAHPDTVVGLVFVDPRGPGVTDEWVAALPPQTAGESVALTGMRDILAEILVDPPDNPEGLSLAASEAEVRAALGTDSPPFGDIPLIVLQAGLTPNAWVDPAEPAGVAWKAAWFDGQAALATTSTAGRLDVVADSGHFIQSDAPSVMIDAILEVLARR